MKTVRLVWLIQERKKKSRPPGSKRKTHRIFWSSSSPPEKRYIYIGIQKGEEKRKAQTPESGSSVRKRFEEEEEHTMATRHYQPAAVLSIFLQLLLI